MTIDQHDNMTKKLTIDQHDSMTEWHLDIFGSQLLSNELLIKKIHRQELVGTDLKVTNVQPGAINTDMIHGLLDDFSKIYGVSNEHCKQDKMLTAEDIAGRNKLFTKILQTCLDFA